MVDCGGRIYVTRYVTDYVIHPVRYGVLFNRAKTLMTGKTNDSKSVRKLTKLGGKSIGVTIPIEIVRELGWREKQRVTVKKVKGGVIVRDYRSKQ